MDHLHAQVPGMHGCIHQQVDHNVCSLCSSEEAHCCMYLLSRLACHGLKVLLQDNNMDLGKQVDELKDGARDLEAKVAQLEGANSELRVRD